MLKSMMIIAAVLVLACASIAHADWVSMQTVPVGNPGNRGELSGDGEDSRICGRVDYDYNIGKYEVTAGQYVEFLNAVAAQDTYNLYSDSMWSTSYACKIERTGTAGSYTYSVAPDWADRPVNWVTFWSAARFANWMHHGQPTGSQGPATTETGSYMLNGHMGPHGNEIVRTPSATWVIPTEDEWYKAAYHRNAGAYWDYPTQTNVNPSNDLVDPDPGNNATFWSGKFGDPEAFTIGAPYYRTEVGAHENSVSKYGTYDQGGNLCEWTETLWTDGYKRVKRGGGFNAGAHSLGADYRHRDFPQYTRLDVGFRLAYVPEPGTIALLLLGVVVMLRRRC